MPRQSRVVIPDIAHHVTQRGNYQQTVFESDNDFRKYRSWIKEYSEKYNVEILAFCLMRNHVHFIVIPKTIDGLSRTFNTTHMRYAQYINKKRGVVGHLWQGRFFSCLLDDVHLYRAIRYVECNPVRKRIVAAAWDYQWSSARDHVGGEKGIIPLRESLEMTPEEWQSYLTESDSEMVKEIRLKTKRGNAVGTAAFMKRIEQEAKRSFQCINPGRSKKKV
ncbi:MAG: transposase [Candidatus Omnitrophica bacterium]|nr:transposase [Candidatus Omnitrophota bacterium]